MRYTADPLIKLGLRPDYNKELNQLNDAIAGIATTSSSFWEANNGGIRYQGHIAVGTATVDTTPTMSAIGGTTSATINNNDTFTNGSLTNNALILNTMTVDATANNAANWIAQDGLVEVKSGNNKNYTGLIAGDGGAAYHYGSGTIAEFDGIFGIVQNNSSGTVTTAQAVRAVSLHYGSGTVTNNYGVSSQYIHVSGTNTTTNNHGLHVYNPLILAGTLTTNYGIYVEAQTGAGTTNIGAMIGNSTTNTLWVGGTADTTTAAGGIVFGISKDTNLYRSAANVLKTDDALDASSFRVAGSAGASGSFTTTDLKTVTVTNGIITSIV